MVVACQIAVEWQSKSNRSFNHRLIRHKYTQTREKTPTWAHANVERFANESKQGCAEVDRSVLSNGHVHADQFLHSCICHLCQIKHCTQPQKSVFHRRKKQQRETTDYCDSTSCSHKACLHTTTAAANNNNNNNKLVPWGTDGRLPLSGDFRYFRRLRFSSDADIVRLTNARIIIIIIDP